MLIRALCGAKNMSSGESRSLEAFITSCIAVTDAAFVQLLISGGRLPIVV
jgi:hypothetical protein